MVPSTAGKARISIVWMVAVGVLFLVSVFYAVVAQGEATAEREKVAAANLAASEATAKLDQQNALRRELSSVLGWYDRSAADPQSQVDVAKKALEDLKSSFPDLGPNDKDFETALPKILTAFGERDRQIGELQTRLKALESELTAAQTATTQVAAEKDGALNTLRQQMADEQRNAEQNKTELEGRLEALRTQVSDRDSEMRKSRDDAAVEKRKFEEQERIRKARISQLSDDLKLTKPPFADQPDGQILEVSSRLGTGWIDLGANQRVVRGMRFQVKSGRSGKPALKAWAEVTNVKADSAEVAFSDVVDRYDPVVAGDVIVNPIYDPVGGRNAVLIGRFSGGYNEKDLTSLLAKMGIKVQPKVDLTTHFLIVGSELWNDPETNEPLESPIQPSELTAYKEAETQGVQIIPLQDIREFIRLGAGQ